MILKTTFTDVVAAINALFGFAIVVIAMRNSFRERNRAYRWIDLLKAFVGCLWGVIYLLTACNFTFTTTSSFGPTFVRPAITFTLGVILANQIFIRYKATPKGTGDEAKKDDHIVD